jgi:tripartite-type tricarboxylate transporter receptor subunit TctC
MACAAFAVGTASFAHAQAWPAKPVRVIVPYAAGGVVDVQTRAVTIQLSQDLGQPFVVEAKPGASGDIAAEFVATSQPDGYTLIVSASFMINNPLMESGLRWKPRDFMPTARFSLSPSYFTVPASLPVNSVKEYVAMAKAKPGMQWANGGNGTPQAMANEMFRVVAGIQIEPVMYKGAPPSIPDLINGLVTMAMLPSSVAYPQVKAGKIKALANISDKRSAQLPDVPTIAEAGYPEVTVLSWYGFHAPAGTPREIIKRLSDATGKATANPEVQNRMVAAGGEIAYLAEPEFEAFLRNDQARWEKFVRALKK